MSSDSDCIYHCPYPGCNYETNRSAHLKRHERTHTKERPYKCQFCDYCASRSDHLRRHYKVHGKALCTIATAHSHRTHQPVCVVKIQNSCASTVKCPVPVTIKTAQHQHLDEGSMLSVGGSFVALLFLQFIHKVRMDKVRA